MPAYHIWTEGCQMNVADSAKLAAGLGLLGYEPVSRPQEADLVVVNTCVVRQAAEDRALSKLGELKRLKACRPHLKIAVMGCMVGPRTEELCRRFPFVDLFTQPQSFDPILRMLTPQEGASAEPEAEDLGGEFWPQVFQEPAGVTAYLPVIHGCDKFCTYCIVPYRRGRERSRPIDEIVREVEHLAGRGAREVTLLGQTVEAYGRDLTGHPDLGDLMAAIHNTPGLLRIRFLTSYPKDMTERIIATAARLPKVCQHINIPVQSGDNSVLQRMRRGYTVEEYKEKVALIRHYMPGAAISSDVIVGFCGETEAEFRNTYKLLEELSFDKVHVAAYSPRAGTIAWRTLTDDVPREVKHQRLLAIEELEERVSRQKNEALLGIVQEVLVEGSKDGRLFGRTPTGKIVHFLTEFAFDRPAGPVGVAGPRKLADSARPGDLVLVRIEKAGSWSLQGSIELGEPVPSHQGAAGRPRLRAQPPGQRRIKQGGVA